MTFDEFKATGRDVPMLDEVPGLCIESAQPGRIYLDCLWIEDASDCGTYRDDPENHPGRWYTVIGRDEFASNNIEEIERHLYEFAASEGMTA